MSEDLKKTHSYLPKLVGELGSGKLDRREFLRISTLLGMSAGAAYALVGMQDPFGKPAKAAMGGTVRISMRVQPIDSPHTYSWIQDSMMSRNVIEYLTLTGSDNVTRPWLCESWEASDDLKTWTLKLRQDVKWSNGDPFVADHVIWNIKRCLDPATGSSVLGLMKGYMLKDVDTGTKDAEGNAVMTTELWDANAIEKVDDHTVRLNAQAAQLAVPEHFFHYPFPMMHPSSEGKFTGVGSIGTGWAEMVEFELGKKCVVKKRPGYWHGDGALDSVEYIDHGDDPAASLAAVASGQADGIWEVQTSQIAALKKMENITLYESVTAQTAVARMQPIHDTWKDPRIRKAMRLCIDGEKVLQVAYLGLGVPAEHHHVAPVHPEYAKLPFMKQDIEGAKKLLAEAGKPDGFESELNCKKDPDWESRACNAMAEMWKQAGINIKVNVLPSDQFWNIWNADTNPFGFTTWTHRPLGVMVLGLAYRTGVPWNESFWSNATFDELLSKAEGTLDVDARRAIVQEIETLMQEEGPIVQPLWRSVFNCMDKKVKGFAGHPTGYVFPWDWSLEG